MSYPRRRIIQTGGALAGATLAGCISVSDNNSGDKDSDDKSNGGDSSGGTAKLWHSRPKGPKKSLETNIGTFESETSYSITDSEISELEQKLENAIPAGKGPHLFQWAHDWIGEYQPAGFLSNQKSDLDVDPDSTYTKAAAEAVQFNGEVVGLPYAAETVGLLYNEELVDKPPETVSEMQSIMDEHHDPSNGTYGLSFPIDPYFVSGYAQAFGGFYYDEQNDELGLSNEKTLKGFRFIRDNLANYISKDIKYDPQVAVFNEGNAPFAINGPWYLGTARDNDLDVGVAPLPGVQGGTPNPYTTVKIWYFCKKMNGGGKDAEAARKFAEWHTTNTDVLSTLAEEHGFIPVHKDLAGSDELSAATKAYSKSVEMGGPIPTHEHMNSVWDPLANALTKVVKGDQKAKPAFKRAEKTIKNNWQ